MSDAISDQIRRHLAGDTEGTERLARRALTLALRTAAAVLRSREAASDVAQEVAVEAIMGLPRLRDPAAFDAWVHRITVRHTMRELRARQRQRRREEPLGDRDIPSRAEPPDARAVALVDALAALPARQQVALALRYVHDLSDEEIATALGCRRGTVVSLLSRGREALRKHPSLRAMTPSPSKGGHS